MSDYINVPLFAPLKRITLRTDSVKILEDDDGKVFVIDDQDVSYECDMDYKNLEKLLISRSIIARGRAKSLYSDVKIKAI